MKENLILGDYEAQINKIINGNRNDENSQLKKCNITISETGTITVQNVEKMAAFAIMQDEKFKDITKNETYSITVPTGQTVSIYVIAIDENGNVYKSDVTSYTGKALYLYNEGDQCTSITGGWTHTGMHNSSANLTDYNYFLFEEKLGSYDTSAISTNLSINITPYDNLYMEYTMTNLVNNYGVALKLCEDVYTIKDSDNGVWKATTEWEKDTKERAICVLSVKDYIGSYFIGEIKARM